MSASVWRCLAASLAATLLATGLLGVSAGRVMAADSFSGALDEYQVVPGPGGPDVTGYATITVDGAEVCLDLTVAGNEDVLTIVGLYLGEAGEPGELVATFPDPAAADAYQGCVTDADLAAAVLEAPPLFFVQAATDAFPDGLVRGQLVPPTVRVRLATYACPEGVRSLADIDPATFEPCVNVVRTGDVPAAPDGYTIVRPPVGFDLEATLTDDAGELAIGDAELDGGATCDPATTTCTYAYGYVWSDAVPGVNAIRSVTVPAGYRFGAALAWVAGQSVTPTVVTSTRTVTIDTTDATNAEVVVFDFRAAAPGGTARPTLPPTSTLSLPGSAAAADASVMLVVTLMGGLTAILGALFVVPGRRR